jgi:hypothetical protein
MATKRTSSSRTTTLTDQYLEFLTAEGYRPRCDDTDDEKFKVVVFKVEGETFLVFVYEDDPDYFCIGHSYTAQDDERTLIRRACHVNDNVKGVKCSVYAAKHEARFMVESFLGGAKLNGAMLSRALDALRYAVRQFFEGSEHPGRDDA